MSGLARWPPRSSRSVQQPALAGREPFLVVFPSQSCGQVQIVESPHGPTVALARAPIEPSRVGWAASQMPGCRGDRSPHRLRCRRARRVTRRPSGTRSIVVGSTPRSPVSTRPDSTTPTEWRIPELVDVADLAPVHAPDVRRGGRGSSARPAAATSIPTRSRRPARGTRLGAAPGAVLGGHRRAAGGGVRRRVRGRAPARPSRGPGPGDGVLPVQQRRGRRRQLAAAGREGGDRRLGRPPRQRHPGHLLRRPERALRVDARVAAVPGHRACCARPASGRLSAPT